MKSNSYLDDDELEFYVINYLIKEEKKGRSWIRDLMGLKVDCELSLQSVKVFKMKKEIKSWVRISHPKLHPPSLNRIRKKILDLQELGGKKEQPTGHRYFHGNVSFEGKAKLVNHWDRIRKKRNDKILKLNSIYFENMEKNKNKTEIKVKSKSYNELKPLTPDYKRKIKDDKKKYAEEKIKDKTLEKALKKLTSSFNKELAHWIRLSDTYDQKKTSVGEGFFSLHEYLVTRSPTFDELGIKDTKTATLVKAGKWWNWYIEMAIEYQRCFPNEPLQNNIKKIVNKLQVYNQMQDPREYTKIH